MKSVLTRAFLLFALVVLAACGGGGPGGNQTAIVKIEITPNTLIFSAKDQSQQLSAKAYDAQGKVIDTTFEWRSSATTLVSVDSTGKVQAVSEVGSAQIIVQAEGVASAPALIAVVETKPGTVMVSDEQVIEIGNPSNLTPNGFPGVGTLYDVRLKGVTPPEAGTIVLASETKAVAGKVVSSQQQGEEVTVRLEVVALPDLLNRYDLDWNIDLRGYELVDDESVQNQRSTNGGLTPLAKVTGLNGALKCEAGIETYLSQKTVSLSLNNNATLVVKSKKFEDNVQDGYSKVALVGDITLTGSIGIKAEVGLKGKGECRIKKSIPIPWGPWAVVIAPAIPIGVGVTLEGKLEVASLELALEGKNGANFELGFECGPGDTPCKSLDKVEGINEFKPKVTVPSSKNMRVELSASAYFFTGLDVVVGLGLFRGNVLEVTIGPKQAANLAFTETQAADEGYASNYDLKFEVNGGPGEDLSKVIKKFTGKEASLNFGFTLAKDISQSPVGTLSTDKTKVNPNETVNFTVDLNADSVNYFLLGYNVESVELYRRLEGESDFKPFRTFPFLQSGIQTTFVLDWTPTEQDAGMNEFAAFVKTKMPVIELEIAKNSIKKVEVKCFSGGNLTASTQTNTLAPQQQTCEDKWAGTFSGTSDFFTFEGQVEWAFDQSDFSIAQYKPSGGSLTYHYTGPAVGCTVTPSTQPLTANDGELTIDYTSETPTFDFHLSKGWLATWDCGRGTFEEQVGGVLSGSGLVSEDGNTIAGQDATGNFNFTR